MSGNIEYPLYYTPRGGKQQEWTDFDFFRVTSMESTNEQFNGLGFSAISRALELAKIMVAIWQHDQEKLGARASRGLLLLHNVSEEQWENAMIARDAKLDSEEHKYYGAVSVLASSGQEQLDAKLIALSELPDNFDQQTAVDLTMYGYALCFGYDPAEFWPVKYGSMGRGRETEVQHIKATGKGGLDHVLSWQEQLQEELPDSLQFDFEHRDEAGEMLTASVMQAKIEAIAQAYETGLMSGMPLITREEARSLLAEQGVIPYEWTEIEEDVEVDATEDPEASDSEKEPTEEPTPEPEGEEARRRDELLSNFRVLRACEKFRSEPIVRYQFPSNKFTVLFESGDAALRPRLHTVAKIKKRQDDSEVLYTDADVTITELDVERAIKEAEKRIGPEAAELMRAEEMTPEELAEAYPEGRSLLQRARKLFARQITEEPLTTDEKLAARDLHIHYHNDALPIERQDEKEETQITPEQVVVNVPETPVDVNLEATFYLKEPDQVIETETFVEREPHDRRIMRTTSVSKKKKK
jgi:hypothetical protein